MGSPNGNYRGIQVLESDTCLIAGFIALNGASDVIGTAPVDGTANPAGPYTMFKGLSKAIGVAGKVATQPHTSTGTYTFTLDEPWWALLMPFQATLLDAAGSTVDMLVQSNVRNTNVTNGPYANGLQPGNTTTVANNTIIVTFRNNTGTLTDPQASGGFYFAALLKRTGRG